MRFLMLNWRDPKNPKAGGAERVTEGYLRALIARGHEAAWFAYAFPGAPAEEELDGLRVARGGQKLGAVLAAWKWARRQPRFDLVIDQHHGLPWYAPWWCGTACVAYIHEVLGPIWRSFYRGFTAWFGERQERFHIRLYRNVQFWTASNSTRRMLRELGVRRVRLIPYGVDTEAIPELDPKPIGEPLRLAVVSRLAPNKRIDHALRAFRILLDWGVEAELTVVGAGDDEEKLRRLAGELGLGSKARFTGLVSEEEKNRILRRAHLLLHTSLREGWGLNVIEANAMGTPAAVYPAPGLVESTLHDRTGVVTEEESPEALARAVEALLRDEARYQRYRRAAWERAREFHWSRVLPIACEWLEAQARAGREARRRAPQPG
ncbi:MAG: glycosyltransferase family 4 protein [Verrucomicrobia bacterium]|nr:glycosyltransferase family 4 protein [Verrucomicrobiota bacterium]